MQNERKKRENKPNLSKRFHLGSYWMEFSHAFLMKENFYFIGRKKLLIENGMKMIT